MEDAVVDGYSARYSLFQHFVDSRTVSIEVVKRKRTRMRVDKGKRIVERREANDRQDRPEDLLLHQAHGVVCLDHQRRRKDAALCCEGLTRDARLYDPRSFASGVIDE